MTDDVIDSIRKTWGDNRKLWNDIFAVLKQHQDLLSEWHDRSQILSFQIDTLDGINRILSDTLKICNNKTPEPHPRKRSA